jgi:hypothetical protein
MDHCEARSSLLVNGDGHNKMADESFPTSIIPQFLCSSDILQTLFE